MKIKAIHLTFLLLLTTLTIFGQNKIIGDWYTPVRSKFLKIIIKNDSIILTKQKFNLSEKSNYSHEGLFKIETKLFDNNTFSYVVSETKFIDKSDLHGDKSEITGEQISYKILTFKSDSINKKLAMAIYSLDSNFTSKDIAEQFLNELQTDFIGIDLYDNLGVEIETKKKNINLILLNDFKKYLEEIIIFDNANRDKIQKKYKLNYVYKESIIRKILSKIGYNSFCSGRDLELIIEKYSKDSEIKKLLNQISNSNEL